MSFVSQGYQPQVYYPRTPKEGLYQRLLQQCEGADVRVLKQLPEKSSELDDQFDLFVDAIFGFSFRPPIRADWLPVFAALRSSTRPLLAIDIPSGTQLPIS